MIDRLVSVSADEYARIFPTPSSAFASVEFNLLNAAKVEQLLFLAGTDTANRPEMGIIIGRRDGIWRAPFSAPMAPISWNSNISLASVFAFFEKLKTLLSPSPIRITLPPSFIAPDMLAKISGASTNLASKVTADFNYHYDLDLAPDFEAHLKRNARKNFRQAQSAGFIFEKTDLTRAYTIIAANRKAKGYYLAMTLSDLEATARIIDIDSFTLSLDGTDVATAIVYHLTPEIAHVVYWGDTPGFEHHRPMNILPFHIFNHYHSHGYRHINIGPSSTDGIPNHGLCSFKESLGCHTTTIPTITL